MKISLLLTPILAILLAACSSVTLGTNIFQNSPTAIALQIPVTAPQTFDVCAGPVIKAIDADYEQAVIEKTNDIRMQNGLPPLAHATGLDESARFHVADMSVNNYFSHNTIHVINGESTQVCDTWNRIQDYYTNWEALGENIAAGQRTPDQAMNGWMNSPEHKDNILNKEYWEIGVGFYEGKGDYHFYWGQNFGRRDNVFPLVLDGEKAKTSSPVVPVYVYGQFEQMRLRTDNGAWGNWQSFRNNFNWKLPNSAGLHTVTAELRGGPDIKATSSDAITVIP